MSYTVKVRGRGLILAEYLCEAHGRFEATQARDEDGNPPASAPCPHSAPGQPCVWAQLVISATKTKTTWANAVTRGRSAERPPGVVDTRPLAEGMPYQEWRASYEKADKEKRHKQIKEALS